MFFSVLKKNENEAEIVLGYDIFYIGVLYMHLRDYAYLSKKQKRRKLCFGYFDSVV